MHEPVLQVNVAEWVARAQPDPVAYQQRQTIEITLNAIAAMTRSGQRMFLKGGILMGLVYSSPRQTTDVDLTADFPPDTAAVDEIERSLNIEFPRAAAALGYADLVVRIQSIQRMPRKIFETARYPALKIKVASALRGSRQEGRLLQGAASVVIDVDISFNESWTEVQVLELTGGNELLAYGLTDLIAEKYRALLQQVPRNRNRRQDVYDLDILISNEAVSQPMCTSILNALITKCRSREIHPTSDSLENPEIRERAGADWASMKLELGELPDFEDCFARVLKFYRTLPWDGQVG